MARTKTQDKAAIKVLPALRASLLRYKRASIKTWQERLRTAATPKMRAYVSDRLARLRAEDLASLRAGYMTVRATEITRAPLAELRAVRPNIVRLSAA